MKQRGVLLSQLLLVLPRSLQFHSVQLLKKKMFSTCNGEEFGDVTISRLQSSNHAEGKGWGWKQLLNACEKRKYEETWSVQVWAAASVLVMLSCNFKFPQKDKGVAQVAVCSSLCCTVAEFLRYEQPLHKHRGSNAFYLLLSRTGKYASMIKGGFGVTPHLLVKSYSFAKVSQQVVCVS